MSKPPIALFGNHGSKQVAAIREALVRVGADPRVFDIQLGGENRPDITMGGGRAVWGGVDFAKIQAIHIRCTSPNTLPALPPLLNASDHLEWRLGYVREQGFQSAIFSFFSYLISLGKLVINPLTKGFIDHDTKGQFYENLRASGFPVPITLTTNDPEQAEAFIREHEQVVVKPAIGVGSTRIVSQSDRERLGELRISPVMMQERSMGDTLRVHIVGDKVVLALRILSEGGVDSRTETKNFKFFQMPVEEAQRMVRANHHMGLHYAAWDIIDAGGGKYVYLDCNPGPYVMWIGPDFVRVVFHQLALYMVTFAQTGSLEEAAKRVTPWQP